MFQSYLKIAIRSLRKNRLFSIINVAGLGLGIAAFILIFEYVAFEKSVNMFHKNLPTLYRMLESRPTGDVFVQMAPAIAPLIKKEFNEVKAYCRIAEGSANGIVTIENPGENGAVQSFREDGLSYADASFFTLFTFPLLSGNAQTALSETNTIALSASRAKKYFGTEKVLGKTLVVNNQFGKTLYTVAAVYQDIPENSDLKFDAILSLQTLANPANLNGNDWARLDGFDGSYVTNFIQVTEKSSYTTLENKINTLKKKLDAEDKSKFVLQPMANIHLGSSMNDSYQTSGSLSFVYLLSGIAILILVIAWFNYINLSTAASLKRAKEVGVRKVVGAGRFQLINQFLGESFLLNIIGFSLALLLVFAVQKSFNDFTQKNFSLQGLLAGPSWIAAAVLLVLGAFLSGGYVAFSVTSLQPIQILKGASGLKLNSGKENWLRKILVVLQFSISVILIISTLVLYKQLQYMQTKDLGFKADQRLVIKGPQLGDGKLLESSSALLDNQVSALPYVKSLCHTGIVPGNYYSFNAAGIVKQGEKSDDAKKSYAMGIIDDRYLSVFQIGLAAGRNFTVREAEQAWEKSGKLMINESAARQLGFESPQKAAGAMISWGQPFEIVGVVKDYNHQGLQEAIDPIVFMPRRSGGKLVLQLSTTNMQRQLKELESLYKTAYPGNPFEYYFVDQKYNEQYNTEKQYSQVFALASMLAIFIACLGLFGLASYLTEQRTKEIGVRKVLGASIAGILTLVSKDFLKLVIISIVIACPIAGYVMHEWLQDFAYQTDIAWWMFVAAGGLVIFIAVLTVGFQSIKAALMNPVESLRNE
ncbi:ABC transporter permease [Dyadobacter arcticus]|uniref:ABC transport system permease protein n=1 Tax=Dyadobacter arcticus TaxID=1078754 RepID=A0ABX0UM54_9BACT|nr:ABC transporter permease [Dyadobacter arcticus]NIJ52710.1 putative ABC transport system permease protein [Dyadobacter arcticus]